MAETKGEIQARIDELGRVREEFWSSAWEDRLQKTIDERIANLKDALSDSDEDIFKSVIRSHEAICLAKRMDPRAAYGQDPAIYYSLAICGEAGEMGNKIVKALRNGNDPEATLRAVVSELPDVIIYSAVLAHVLNMNLAKLVNEKVEVVIQRAESGYYGGPLEGMTSSLDVIKAYRDGTITRVEAVSRLAAAAPDEEDSLREEAVELRKRMAGGEAILISDQCG